MQNTQLEDIRKYINFFSIKLNVLPFLREYLTKICLEVEVTVMEAF